MRKQSTKALTKIHYELDNWNECYRVWPNNQFSDQFLMIPIEEFEGVKKLADYLPTLFIEGMPENE